MRESITITSKGQTTLPAAIRKQLGIDKQGGVLRIRFNEERGELIISRPLSISALSTKLSSYIKPGIQPVTDVDEFYQSSRKVT